MSELNDSPSSGLPHESVSLSMDQSTHCCSYCHRHMSPVEEKTHTPDPLHHYCACQEPVHASCLALIRSQWSMCFGYTHCLSCGMPYKLDSAFVAAFRAEQYKRFFRQLLTQTTFMLVWVWIMAFITGLLIALLVMNNTDQWSLALTYFGWIWLVEVIMAISVLLSVVLFRELWRLAWNGMARSQAHGLAGTTLGTTLTLISSKSASMDPLHWTTIERLLGMLCTVYYFLAICLWGVPWFGLCTFLHWLVATLACAYDQSSSEHMETTALVRQFAAMPLSSLELEQYRTSGDLPFQDIWGLSCCSCLWRFIRWAYLVRRDLMALAEIRWSRVLCHGCCGRTSSPSEYAEQHDDDG